MEYDGLMYSVKAHLKIFCYYLIKQLRDMLTFNSVYEQIKFEIKYENHENYKMYPRS